MQNSKHSNPCAAGIWDFHRGWGGGGGCQQQIGLPVQYQGPALHDNCTNRSINRKTMAAARVARIMMGQVLKKGSDPKHLLVRCQHMELDESLLMVSE